MKIKLFLILSFFFFVNFQLHSQVTASFTATPTQGCAPLQVSFTNNSTGSGTLTYLWVFGNGNSSIVQSPFPQTYSLPGTYTVTLTVSNGSQSNTTSQTITVIAPTAQFTANVLTGCDSLTVQFTDQSIANGAVINGWQWDFGDGGGATIQNPIHTFTSPGLYTVFLRAFDSNGCHADITKTNYIIVSQTPNSNISADITSYCIAPITINFSYTPNIQPVPVTLTYNWTFGDGGTATIQNPSHLYDTTGLYDVSLSVTDQYGCTSNTSINDYINLTTVNASFYVAEGDTVCPNSYIHLVNTSGVSGLWIYQYGNTGTIDSTLIDNNLYINISFIAAPGTACADTATKQIMTAPPVIPSFLIDEPYGCKVPHTVNFTNTTVPPGVSWAWNFGDATTATSQNPTHTYNSQGTFTVSFTLTNQMGCKGTLFNQVTVEFPNANFLNDTNLGCISLPVHFTDASTCNTTYDNISGWQWNFGQGAPSTSNQQNPTHNFTTDGDFMVHLTITTAHGCTAKDSMVINVGSHQNLAFIIDTTVACAQDTIKIINLSQDVTKIDTFLWTFGPALTSNLQDPEPFVVKNTVDTGWVDFTLITDYNGCKDTLIDSAYIKGPIIKTMSIVTDLMHCGYDSSYVYYLTTETQGGEYWKWNWRDSITSGADSVTNDTIRHQYLTSGNRTVSIWAFNDATGCIYKDSIVVRPRDIRANLQFNDTMCYSPNAFNSLTLKDAVDWKWKFGDATPPTAWSNVQTVTHTFDTSGYYLVWMYSRTDNELQCIDSTSKYVRIFKPEVEFYADTLIGCAQSPIVVPFHSTSFSPDTNLVSWMWNLGDGQNSTDTICTASYPIPGYKNITLQITDGFGCINSITKLEYIASLAVTADFTTPQNTYCINEPIPFLSTSTSIPPDYPPVHYSWYFGNGDSSHVANPNYAYPVKGTYDVMLVISDTLGCYDTLIMADYIEAQTIIASFTSDTSSTCYPFVPSIVNNTLVEYNPIFSWNFGDGATSNDTIPIHAYTMPGNYYLVLEAATSHGCQDKDSVRIHVGGPYADITIDQTQICQGDTINFSIVDTISVATYSWNFGDGAGASNISPVFHQYNYVPTNGTFNVSLFYNSPAGDCPKVKDTVINLYQVVAHCVLMQSGVNDSIGCNPLPITVTDTSTGATNWIWDFGDGTTFNGQNPGTHTFVNSTQSNQFFNVSLIITNGIGCTDTSIKKVLVYPTPAITLLEDSTICRGNNITLLSAGGDSIRWNNDTTLSSLVHYNPVAIPTVTTTYYATITSYHGSGSNKSECINSDSVKITVQQVPDLSTSPDTVVVIGEYIDIFALSGQSNVSYQWSPSPNDNSMTCTNCSDFTSRPLKNTDYTIHVRDSLGCFSVEKIVHIIVDAKFSVDVPKVFTPNDDGHNDLIFPRGWGVESLKSFKIFNRWGQLIYETSDLNAGWNGMFNGKIQPSDTYTYFVEMNMLDGSSLSKKGTFDLLR